MKVSNNGLSAARALDLAVAERLASPELYAESSTIQISSNGLAGIVEKLGEETAELIQAVVDEDAGAVLDEAQTVLYVASIGLAYAGIELGLFSAVKQAQTIAEEPITSRNMVVKTLGRSAAKFGFSLGIESPDLLVDSVRLVSGVEAIVRYRQLSLTDVLERI